MASRLGPSSRTHRRPLKPRRRTRGHVRDHRALQPADRPRADRFRSERARQHLSRRLVEQPDRAGLHRADVPARRGVLRVRADPAAGVGVRGDGDVPASGPVLDRGHRLRASDRAPAQLLPAGLAGARAVPRRPPGYAGGAVSRSTRRMATDAHGRRDGRGGQQRRGGGVRRPGAGRRGRPLARDPGRRRSSSSELGPSRCTNATTVARATPTAHGLSIAPRS